MLEETLKWQDFIKPLKIQKLLNDFSVISGISLIIMDVEGKKLTTQTMPHNNLCMDIIKGNPIGGKNCEYCDRRWSAIAAKEKTCKIYTCKNGLVDFVTPIILENEVTAFLFGGQIRLKKDFLDEYDGRNKNYSKAELASLDKQINNGELIVIPDQWYKNHANKLDIDSDRFFLELSQITELNQVKIDAAARVLSNIAETIAYLISRNLAAQRVIKSNDQILFEIKDLISSLDTTRNILNDLMIIVPYKKASLQLIVGDNRTLIDCRGFEPSGIEQKNLQPISEDKLVAKVIKNRSPIILSDVNDDDDWKAAKGTEDVKSWIGAPIIYNNNPIGLITIDHNQKNFFKPEYRNKIIAFINEIAPSLWHSLMLNDVGALISHMTIINEIAKSINVETELQDVLNKIVSVIAKHLNCTHCTIFLLDKEDDKTYLIPRAAEGKSQKTMERRFYPGEGLAGKVLLTGETIITANAHLESDFSPARVKSNRSRSMLVAAIKAGNKTIGVICADQDEYNWFKEKDRQFIDALAQHAGIAIKRSNDIEIQRNIGNKLLVLNDIDDILQTLISGAIKLINVTHGVIYLISKDGYSHIKKYHPPGFPHPDPRLDKKYERKGLTRTIIDTAQPLVIANTKLDDRVVPLLKDSFCSIIGVPIIINNYVIGVFYLNDKEYHNFNKSEISILSTLANQAAIALQNMEFRKILRRENSLLDEILINLIIEEQDEEQALQKIGEGIIKLLGEEVAPTINLYYEEEGVFGGEHVYGSWKNSDILKVPPRSVGGTGRFVIETDKPLYINDVKRPPKDSPNIRKQSIKNGIKSFAAIPLKRGNKTVGVLFINSLKKITFDAKIKHELDIFANQASLAIHLTQLHKETETNNALIKSFTLDSVTYEITHEFRNYLQSYLNYTGLIKNRSKEPEIRLLVRDLDCQIKLTSKFIDNYFKLHKKKNEIEVFDVRELVQTIIDSYEYSCRSQKIEFNFITRQNKILVETNPTEILILIINLLNNAKDAVINHSKSYLIELEIYHEKKYLYIIIKDSGGGINPNFSQQIFSQYFTTKSSGLGIGLYLVKKIIDKNNGEISYEDNDKDGTTFIVKLPLIIKD